MKQEYIVIPKQNEWLHDLIGKSLNQKLIHKALEDLYDEHRIICRPGLAKAIVTVSDSKTKEILGIGGSSLLENLKTGKKIADITNRNYGVFTAGICRNVSDANRNADWFRRASGSSFPVRVINQTGSSAAMFNEPDSVNFPVGTRFQVGSGVTPPTSTDLDIETAFGSSPEDIAFDSGGAAFNDSNQQIPISSGIVAGGAGTINESAWHFFGLGSSSTESFRSFMWFHDAISPGVPFIATQTITVSYLLQM